MSAERDPLRTGLVTLPATCLEDMIVKRLDEHAVTHLAFEMVPQGDYRSLVVYALRDVGGGAAAVEATSHDTGLRRGNHYAVVLDVLDELDRLAAERERVETIIAADRERERGGATLLVPCRVCGGTGRNPLSDTTDHLPCIDCRGTGAEQRR